MTDMMAVEKNPDFLLEAARVLNQAGPAYKTAAAALAAAALQVSHLAKPEVRDAIMGDVAALYLSERLPGGYEAVLKLLESLDGDKVDDDGKLENARLHLLRALAWGQKYNELRNLKDKAQKQDDKEALAKELAKLVPNIRNDLKTAFERNEDLWEENQCVWLSDPMKGCMEEEDDLRKVYADDPAFKEWIDKVGVDIGLKKNPDQKKDDPGPPPPQSGPAQESRSASPP